jgi:hypothetical protein
MIGTSLLGTAHAADHLQQVASRRQLERLPAALLINLSDLQQLTKTHH